ncbi:ETX/MTX2 family pore-forming toxin, partial [Clostridium botulinum]|uniref:ETX/MTX2 family pore-forming toxin n=1 Tax=Clostridium botulinum TaxID=1491 RepID=UPI0004D7932D
MIQDLSKDYFKLVESYCEKTETDVPYEKVNIRSCVYDSLKEGKNDFEIVGSLGIQPIGDPIFTKGETAYVGSTVLTNETNIDQKIRTESFTKQESFTTTSKTTHGFKLGVKGSAKFSVKFFGNGVELSTEISTEYNFSSEKTETISQSHTLTVPSQEILVPAKSKIQVTAVFNKGYCSGKVLLKAVLRGYDDIGYCFFNPIDNRLEYCPSFGISFDKLARIGDLPQFKPIPDSYDQNTETGEMEILGAGEYTSSLATNFMVHLKQLDLKGNEIGKSR